MKNIIYNWTISNTPLLEAQALQGYDKMKIVLGVLLLIALISAIVGLKYSGDVWVNENNGLLLSTKRIKELKTKELMWSCLAIGLVVACVFTMNGFNRIKANAIQQLITNETESDKLFFLEARTINQHYATTNNELKSMIELEIGGEHYIFEVQKPIETIDYLTDVIDLYVCNTRAFNLCLAENDYKGVWMISYDGGETCYLSYANFSHAKKEIH